MPTPSPRLRRWTPDDADIALTLFQRAVYEVASRHYTRAQLDAWAGGIDPAVWAHSLSRQCTWLAILDDTPAGFASLNNLGHLEMLFVSPDYQRCGVARALLTTAEDTARQRGLRRMTTDASLTARPFFEAQGFEVVKAQEIERRGERLKNFAMGKRLKGIEPGENPARAGQI